MNKYIGPTIKIIGMMISIIGIFFSLFALFALQGIGGVFTDGSISLEGLKNLFITITILINFVAVPIMLVGFVLDYKVKWITWVAAIHLTFFLINLGAVIGPVQGTPLLIVAFFMPSFLYLLGVICKKRLSY